MNTLIKEENGAYYNLVEYNIVEMRRLLQELFPERCLVMSQFTFFNQIGVLRATGVTSRRGRQCYRLGDILAAAAILALKEAGIPFKNIEQVPEMIRSNSEQIFRYSSGCRLSGFAGEVSIDFGSNTGVLAAVLQTGLTSSNIYWSYDLGALAAKLCEIADRPASIPAFGNLRRAA